MPERRGIKKTIQGRRKKKLKPTQATKEKEK
jgi:hypothetical protein